MSAMYKEIQKVKTFWLNIFIVMILLFMFFPTISFCTTLQYYYDIFGEYVDGQNPENDFTFTGYSILELEDINLQAAIAPWEEVTEGRYYYDIDSTNINECFVSYDMFLADSEGNTVDLLDSYLINYFFGPDPVSNLKIKLEDDVEYLAVVPEYDWGLEYNGLHYTADSGEWPMLFPKVTLDNYLDLIFQEEACKYNCNGCAVNDSSLIDSYIILQYSKMEPVPEPSSMLLFAIGIAGLTGSMIRRKK